MSDQDLIAQLQASLSSVLGLADVIAHAGADLFEAYAFELVLRAAAAENYNVAFEHNDGSVATDLLLRTHPGHMETDSARDGLIYSAAIF